MKRIFLVLWVFLLAFQYSIAQYSVAWKRGLEHHGYIAAIKPTPDKGFVSVFNSWGGFTSGICASCDASAAGYNSIVVVKMDSVGKIEWSNCYTGRNNSIGRDLLVLPGGDIILTGSNSSDNGFFKDIPSKAFWNIFLVKLSADGKLIWKKNLDNPHNEEPAKIITSREGGFVVAATSDNPVSYSGSTSVLGTGDYYLLKFDDNGNLQWNNRYGGSAQEHMQAIQQDEQGNYVAVGWSRSNNGMVSGNPTQNANTWMIKVSPTGQLLTQHVFDLQARIGLGDFLIDPQGNYVFTGHREQGNSIITSDVWAMKASSATYQVLWSKIWSPSTYAKGSGIIATKEGTYLLAAGTRGNSKNIITDYQPSRHWWLLEVDSASGNIVWDRSFGGHSNFYSVTMESVGSDRLMLFGNSNGDQSTTDFFRDTYYGNPNVNINELAVAGYMLLYRNGTPVPVVPAIVNDTITTTKSLCKAPYRHSDGKDYYSDTNFVFLRQNGDRYKVYEKLEIAFNQPLSSYNIDTTICYGAKVNGTSFTHDGETTITIKNQSGCDSIRTRYHVKVLPAVKQFFKDTVACRGSQFLDSLLNTGDRVQLGKVIKNQLQCDSIYQYYNVSIIDPYDVINSRDTVMCYGSVYKGVAYYNNTTLTDTITLTTNCGNVPMLRKFNIILWAELKVNIGEDIAICPGANVVLNAKTSSPANQYLWSNGATKSSITVNAPGVYWVKVMNDLGCSASDSVVIASKGDRDNMSMSAVGNTTICKGESTTLRAQGGISYAWSPASSLNCNNCAEVIATPEQTTAYQVRITGNCAQDTVMIVIHVEQAEVDAGKHRQIMVGDTVHMQTIGNGVSYKWSPETGLSCTTCPAPIAQPQASTQYTVTMLTAAGCMTSDTVSISVSDRQGVVLGTLLTPDGDGINDVSRPSNPFLSNFKLEIYNNYGQAIFRTNDPAKGWDGSIGSYNGTKATPGVYFYLMEYRSATGTRITQRGRIVLVR